MIKIEKTKTIPDILSSDGKTETENFKEAYSKNPNDAKKSKKELGFEFFKIDIKIYGDSSVKQSLRACQYEKCCFCERKIEIGDIEHYRPKKGYKQDENETLQRPGYYWLAYDWDNLLLSCAACNRSFKKNYFPLANLANRATSHLDDISKEEPLIINPSTENPEDFIEYRGHHLKVIHGNKKGLETIKRVGLDRRFIDERRDHYIIFKRIFEVSQEKFLPEKKKEELLKLIEDASQKDKEYAGMIRSAIRHNFRF